MLYFERNAARLTWYYANYLVAAQRNDNPDDSASEGGPSDEEEDVDRRERRAARDTAERSPKEKQPTGRVVGVMKRNWRA